MSIRDAETFELCHLLLYFDISLHCRQKIKKIVNVVHVIIVATKKKLECPMCVHKKCDAIYRYYDDI